MAGRVGRVWREGKEGAVGCADFRGWTQMRGEREDGLAGAGDPARALVDANERVHGQG